MNSEKIALTLANSGLTYVRMASKDKEYVNIYKDGAVEQFQIKDEKASIGDALRAAVFSAGIDANSKDLGAEL